MTATAAGGPMTEVRCPMRECRRRIDLDALPASLGPPESAPCLHFIAAWSEGRAPMVEEVFHGLAGNRELAIRNLRPAEVSSERLDVVRAALESGARRFAHEADGVALFGDIHERNAVAREFAQLILGPDPMVRRTAGGA